YSRDLSYFHSFPTRRSSDLIFLQECMEFSFRILSMPIKLMRSEPIRLPMLRPFASYEIFLPIIRRCTCGARILSMLMCAADHRRSEEHTSELQSRGHLVCRL